MAKKKPTAYPPLALLTKIAGQYPLIWRYLENFHKDNGKEGLPPWDPSCYVPTAVVMSVVTGGHEDLGYKAVRDCQQVASIAPWRQKKQVYVLAPDLETALYSDLEELSQPSVLLKKLPESGIYLEMTGMKIEGHRLHGMFAHLDYNFDTGLVELHLLTVPEDGTETASFIVRLKEDETIEQAIRYTVSYSAMPNASFTVCEEAAAQLTGKGLALDSMAVLLALLLQPVLCLCSGAARIVPHAEQKSTMHSYAEIKDRYSEICKWDVSLPEKEQA